MRKINFNISDSVVINWKKTLLYNMGLLLISSFLILAGVLMIVNNRKELQENLLTLNTTENKLESITAKSKEWDQNILKKNKLWGKEIDFINKLIDGSTKPIISRMNILEGILPDGVHITKFSMGKTDGDLSFLITVSSDQFTDLYSFYDKLKGLTGKLRYNISNEDFSGPCLSSVKITFKNNETQKN